MATTNSSLPENVSLNGNVFCRPSSWVDVAKFFIFNYFLHAVTVPIPPGIGPAETIFIMITAAFAPFSGSYFGFRKIYRCLRLMLAPRRGKKDQAQCWDLDVAHRAGALCMVTTIRDAKDRKLTVLTPELVEVHGQHPVEPSGISKWQLFRQRPQEREDALCLVQIAFEAFEVETLQKGELHLCSKANVVKSLGTLAQTLYASFELYEGGKNQIPTHGFAAYSLTVVPYILMSIINLTASICEPEYPTFFLVQEKPHINPAPEKLSDPATPQVKSEPTVSGHVAKATFTNGEPCSWGLKHGVGQDWAVTIVMILVLLIMAAPWVVITLLTHWRQGESTRVEQYLLMFYLGIGQYMSPFIVVMSPLTHNDMRALGWFFGIDKTPSDRRLHRRRAQLWPFVIS